MPFHLFDDSVFIEALRDTFSLNIITTSDIIILSCLNLLKSKIFSRPVC